jgi:hypothetical protein
MSKLHFDPVTYQFYYRCPTGDGAPARAVGFRWDPLRRRYYTLDPKVAAELASRGDNYVKLLLADALGPGVLAKHGQIDAGYRRASTSLDNASASRTIH